MENGDGEITPRTVAEANAEITEKIRAQVNLRIKKDSSDFGGGKRRTNVGT